jgi:cysteine desulfurase/selenocysteine lyase
METIPGISSVGRMDVETIRSQFPILQRRVNGKPLVFLDSAASSQKPTLVIDAISNYYRSHHANVHRGVYTLSQEATERFEQARRRVAKFLNAASEQEIVFVRGTTEGINLVAAGFGQKMLQPGDEVIITTMEHHSNIVPWQMACEASGASLKVIPIDSDGQLDLQNLGGIFSERSKILALTHVSNTLGTINPVQQIIAAAHQFDVPVLVDGAQAVSHMRVDVRALDADFYAFSGHKMYGPTGIGVLYGKQEWLEKLPPYMGGGEMIERVTFEKTTYNSPPFKFEAGTPDIAGAVGLHAAIEFLEHVGLDAIREHEHHLLDYATAQIRGIGGISIYGNAEKKSGVISLQIDGIHPYDVGAILDKLGIAVRTGHHCTQPLMEILKIPGTVRVSFGMYNTMPEVDQLVEGLKLAKQMLT